MRQLDGHLYTPLVLRGLADARPMLGTATAQRIEKQMLGTEPLHMEFAVHLFDKDSLFRV